MARHNISEFSFFRNLANNSILAPQRWGSDTVQQEVSKCLSQVRLPSLQISRCRGTKTHSARPQLSLPLYGSIQGHRPVLKLKPGHRDLIQVGSSWDHFWKADDCRAWIKVPIWVQLTEVQRTWWGCWTAEKLASLNIWIWSPEDRPLFWIWISNSSTLKWCLSFAGL